jgi:exopolyphosphatase/guanosine-5'-triphosphate,3'-diphosphate pyrophosphatase
LYQGHLETKIKESLAIIDLGYNSIKVSIYDIYKNGQYKKRFQKQEYVQIGHGLNKNNNQIPESNIGRTAKALEEFRKVLKDGAVDNLIPIATSAVREASNQKFVVEELKKQTGISFNILSGPEEGFFSYLGAQSYIHVPNGFFFDLGGGSLELIHIVDFKIVKTICLDLGVLRLSDNNLVNNVSSGGIYPSDTHINYETLESFLHTTIPSASQLGLHAVTDLKMVSIGGTVRTLYKFVSRMFNLPISYGHQYMGLNKRMVDLANMILRQLSTNELANLKLIDKQRSKTITVGSFVIKILMEKMKFNGLLVCSTGLREGVLEHYLYFKMDKQYRKRKKFIELNSEPLIVIENNEHKIQSAKNEESRKPLEYVDLHNKDNLSSLIESSTFAFPRKLTSVKINKLI